MKRKILSLLMVFVVLFSFAACQSKEASETTPVESEQTESTEEIDWRQYEGTTLKAFVSYGKIENAFEEFTAKTGITVEFTPLSTGKALAQLNAEDGKSDVDVWLGGGADAYIAAKELGYLLQYVPTGAADIDEMYKDKDGYWTGVSFQAAGFIVNNEVLKELNLPAPKTWEDLTDPKYKGEIIFANPAISGTAYAMLETMYQNWGEEATFDYLERLNENIAYYTEGGGEPSKKVAAGEFAIGFVPITGDFYKLQDEAPVTVITPEELLPWIPSPVAIFSNTKNEGAAKLFADYFTSQEGGNALQKAEARIMARDDVEMPEIMSGVNKAGLVPVDIVQMGENRDKILERFKAIAGL